MWKVWDEEKREFQPIRDGPEVFFKNFIIGKGGKMIGDNVGYVKGEIYTLQVKDDTALITKHVIVIEKVLKKVKN